MGQPLPLLSPVLLALAEHGGISDSFPLLRSTANIDYPQAVGLIPLRNPYILIMTPWQPPKREPPKTKAELREMLTEAVRNTQAENERLQQTKRVKAA